MTESKQSQLSPAAVATVVIATLVVLFAMREAKTVVVPALLAFFLATVADSPVSWLERRGLARAFGILLAVTGMILLAVVIGLLVGSSLQELSEQAPAFQQKTRDQLDALLAKWGGPRVGDETAGVLDYISPDAALGLAAGVLTSVRDLLVFALGSLGLRSAEQTSGQARPKNEQASADHECRQAYQHPHLLPNERSNGQEQFVLALGKVELQEAVSGAWR